VEQRLSLVTLGVHDLDRAIGFYTDLGWSLTARPGDVAFFQVGGMVVGLWGRDQLGTDTAVPDAGGWGGITLAHNVRTPDAVDTVLAEAVAAGGTLLRPPVTTEWGGYSGVFADPDGHPWEVAHNPFWTLEVDGSVRL
jgi:catechol 2,3-dioxygenase-like lactoylglutathione lyase family enzyme